MVESTEKTNLMLSDFNFYTELRMKHNIAADTIDDFKSSPNYMLNQF